MTTNRYCRGIAVAIAALILTGAAHASTIALFNTGVDANGTPLPNGSLLEPHYTLRSVPSGSTTSILVRTSAGGFPINGYWIGDSPSSAWIGPNNRNDLDGPTGHYDYQTTFDLTNFNFATASLIGKWATDNEGVDIFINGLSTNNTILDKATPPTGDPYKAYKSFAITTGFVAGLNTLDFIVNNIDNAGQPNPTGLRVEISGTANTPEPASLVLFGTGFAGLFLLGRKLGVGKL